jgi:hypothetical protein
MWSFTIFNPPVPTVQIILPLDTLIENYLFILLFYTGTGTLQIILEYDEKRYTLTPIVFDFA